MEGAGTWRGACLDQRHHDRMAFLTTLAVAAVLLLGPSATRADTLRGSARAREAMALCHAAAGEMDRAAQVSLLDRGLALAEDAVRSDDGDPSAHFAVFCNLGRRVRLRPLGIGSFSAVRRVRREIDRALALAPDAPELLTAKGVMLLELPGLLGGDAAEGKRLLHRALAVSPGFARAREALRERAAALEPLAARE